MSSPTQRTWVWASSGSWWWTGKPGVLQSMRSQRAGHSWATSLSLSCIGGGNGNPLQCSYLENPRDRGTWWAAIYEVAQSRTRLKWLSSSSRRVTELNWIEGTVTKSSSSGPSWWIFPKYKPVPFILLFKTFVSHPFAPWFDSSLSLHLCIFMSFMSCVMSFMSIFISCVSVLCLPVTVCIAHRPLFLECPQLFILPSSFKAHLITSSSWKGYLISSLTPHNYTDVGKRTCKSLSEPLYHYLKQTGFIK